MFFLKNKNDAVHFAIFVCPLHYLGWNPMLCFLEVNSVQ